MWPFDASMQSLWLGLYVLTFALHAVFVSYVAAGTAYALVAALRRSADPLAARVRDWLPFMLGAGITAGVGPLLFVQLLHQRAFYTANLVMGPRWGAVVPALIVGFYALYLAKASERHRRLALGVGVACFLFVAWSWTELHLLMQDTAAWRAMVAARERFYGTPALVPRLALWLGAMVILFATVAAWSASAAERRRLAYLAALGFLVCGLAGLAGFLLDPVRVPTHGWSYILGGAALIAAVGWAWLVRVPDGPGLVVVTAATTVALLAGAVVREIPRLGVIHTRAQALEAGGLWLFLITLAIGVVAIRYVVRLIGPAAHRS